MKNALGRFLVLSLVMTLGFQACGKKGSKQPVAPQPAPPPPPSDPNTQPYSYNNGSGDIILSNIVPQYQSIYGDITVVTPVSMNGVSIQVGTYSWVNMYKMIQPMICGNGKTCDWSNVNYGQVYNQVSSYYYGSWGQSGMIEFRNPNPNYLGYGTRRSNFGFVFNALVASNYSYYSSPWGYEYTNPNYYYNGGYYPYNYTQGNTMGGSLYINNGNISGSFGSSYRW